MALSEKFQSILWEYDLSKLDLDNDIVVQRVLNLWNKDLTDFWQKKIWKKRAKELFLKNSKNLDKKSLNYWGIVFKEKQNLSNNHSIYDQLNKPIFSRNFR